MVIKENVSLKPYNTFGIDVKGRYFVEVAELEELSSILRLPDFPDKLILSGGSNILFTKDVDALVMRMDLKGIRIVEEDEDTVTIRAMAGENWHKLVLWTLEKGYGGIENLSLIPGNTGTAPIQNIGAYGVELKDVFVRCEAMHIESQEIHVFPKEACKFGYRDSIFKNEAKGKYIITAVCMRLTKKEHELHTAYGTISKELERMQVADPKPWDVSRAVIKIRTEKLPNPQEIGNGGSFFKNPIVSKKTYEEFRKKHPNAPFYRTTGQSYKIPAAWLIDQCGFKGKRIGDAGVHQNQALVLVNYGNASGGDILALAQDIQAVVRATYGIDLHPEVNIIR